MESHKFSLIAADAAGVGVEGHVQAARRRAVVGPTRPAGRRGGRLTNVVGPEPLGEAQVLELEVRRLATIEVRLGEQSVVLRALAEFADVVVTFLSHSHRCHEIRHPFWSNG